MKQLLLSILFLVSVTNTFPFSTSTECNTNIEGVYTMDYHKRADRRILKRHAIEYMCLELRKDNTASFLIKYLGKGIPPNPYYIEPGQGTWNIHGDSIYIVLNEVSPGLYPVQTNTNETIFISYPYSFTGLLGTLVFKIDKNQKSINLTTEGIQLKKFLCEMTEDVGVVLIKGKCHFFKTDSTNASIETWQKRLSEKISHLSPDTFPPSLNPLPIEIGNDSTLKIINRGRRYYDSYDSINSQLNETKRTSYMKFLRLQLVPLPSRFTPDGKLR
ncbi:MAG: hypothetical protein HDS08_01680 [Bacteroides sp.]|nr:hypothetical protein [Bacteroides sp.]